MRQIAAVCDSAHLLAQAGRTAPKENCQHRTHSQAEKAELQRLEQMTTLLSEDNVFLISRRRLQTRNRNTVRILRELWCSKTIERPTDAGLRPVTVNNNKIRRAINAEKNLHTSQSVNSCLATKYKVKKRGLSRLLAAKC